MNASNKAQPAKYFSTAIAAAIATAAMSFSGVAVSDTTNSATEYRWEVDMRGKPPFKRERVAVESVDIASMEISDVNVSDVATETVWEREFTGRPPFNRRQVELPVVDAASMEIVEEAPKSTTFRGRPPFKRHR
ncbi:hypothetical protein [Congregibacter litoralis]|uniref:Uncharacterized protein n=1 Tax=Congregibacter litoralis KT71 TaxID=314285 RepID=A4A946_9GAMM|nr:hypothetical protein [Congregibacter litoralis]EAQ97588.1 hypothetical protein KT71_04745 [Congregibacter litoralis KT71]